VALLRDAEDVREPSVHDGLSARRSRQVGGRDLDGYRSPAGDQDSAVTVPDLAAGGRDRDVADSVPFRLGEVLVPGENLEEPEPEEDDREHRQREAAEHRGPERELWGQWWATVLRGLNHREDRGIGPRRWDGR